MKLLLNKKSGYTLLFATLTAALVLGVAVFILSVSRKQYILSSTAKDSMYSFYAADSGIECVAKNSEARSLIIDPTDSSKTGPTTATVTCGNNTIPITFTPGNPNSSTYTILPGSSIWGTSFTLGFGPEVPPRCAIVKIDHYLDTTGSQYTVIQSFGYNLCTYDSRLTVGQQYAPDTLSPRTVERSLRWTIH